jgi:hypothetical protein
MWANLKYTKVLCFAAFFVSSCSNNELEHDSVFTSEKNQIEDDILDDQEKTWKKYADTYTYTTLNQFWENFDYGIKLHLHENGEFGLQYSPMDLDYVNGKGQWLIKKDEFGSLNLLLKFDISSFGGSRTNVYTIADDDFVSSFDSYKKGQGWPGIIPPKDSINELKKNLKIPRKINPIWIRKFENKDRRGAIMELIYYDGEVNARWEKN